MEESTVMVESRKHTWPPLPELTSLAYVLAPTSTSLAKMLPAVFSTLLSMCFLPRIEGLSLRLHCRADDIIGKPMSAVD